ncbi:hypothetical protein BCR44DRAFT_1488014, partial [Catenaria anguillulae PL171]
MSHLTKSRMKWMLQFVDPVQEDRYRKFSARINQVPVRFFVKGLVVPIAVLVWAFEPFALLSFRGFTQQCPSITGYCYECYVVTLILAMLTCIGGVISVYALKRATGRSDYSSQRRMAVLVGFMCVFMSVQLVGTVCVGLCWVDFPISAQLTLLDSSLNMITICETGRSSPMSGKLLADARLAEVQIEIRHMLASIFLFMFFTVSAIPASQVLIVGMIGFTITALGYGLVSSMSAFPMSSMLWVLLLSLMEDFLASVALIFQRELLSR